MRYHVTVDLVDRYLVAIDGTDAQDCLLKIERGEINLALKPEAVVSRTINPIHIKLAESAR